MLGFYLAILEKAEEKNKFEELYIKYRDIMYNCAEKILGDSYLAEDAVHTAFMKLLNNLEKIEDINCKKTRNYLVIIVRNVSYDLYAKSKNIILIEDADEAASSFDLPEAVENSIERERAYSIILNMDEKYSDILMLANTVNDIGFVTTTDITGVSSLVRLLNLCGVDVNGFWEEYYGNPAEVGGVPSFDLRGNGFCIIASPIPGTGNDMSLIYYYYGDYAVINNPELFVGNHFTYNSSSNVTMNNCICEAYKNGSYNSSYSFSNRKSSYSQSFYGYTLQLYGDIRYRDNSPADDVITPIEYTVINWDDDSISPAILKDFLNKLLTQLSLQNPDLSSVEGLLAAILAECQSINGKLDTVGSSDMSGLLNMINASIISLAGDVHADNASIISLLTELKNSLQNNDGENEQTPTDLSSLMDKLDTIISKLDYLCTISTIDLIGDTIETILTLTEEESKFLNLYAELVTNLISKFGYVGCVQLISQTESIIFTDYPPQDVYIDIFGQSYPFLTVSTFNLYFGSILDSAKMFVSVLILIGWLYIMRKRLAGET